MIITPTEEHILSILEKNTNSMLKMGKLIDNMANIIKEQSERIINLEKRCDFLQSQITGTEFPPN
jgi:hypothetical protein